MLVINIRKSRVVETPHEIKISQKPGLNNPFFHFYPSKITLYELYKKGPYPLDSEHMDDILRYVGSVIDYNCRDDAEVVIFIISDPNHYLLRQDIRETYGKNHVSYKYSFSEALPRNVSHCLLFSIGYRDDITLNQQVDYEAYIYNDIIRIPIFDVYRETAHKIIFTLHLLDRLKHNFEYVLKSDDDIFLKINKIIPDLHYLEKKHVFIGHLVEGATPIRNKNNKWYVSEDDFSEDVYAPYLMGSCYIFRRSIIQNLTIAHYNTTLIPMEDVHISYLVTSLGYNLTNSPHYHHCINFLDCKNSYIVDMGRNMFRRNYLWGFLKGYVTYETEN
ncbi:Beta-1,3-galactosyltransferase 1 [Thelohanellus kitauei]|uniref:Hexosyltransferase n=1 Tax=Thelohanellus kitauei TaxID=669202 RepID=A0A0C2NFA5_THEKT|nr:Beta-1,3-galactosyltransferase 1 [Thelohanellus kitauei]